MLRVAKLAGLVSKPLQNQYLAAETAERQNLRPIIEQESQWMIDRMARKGYRLEARVADVFGLFTRGSARGTVRLVDQPAAVGS